MNNYYDLTIPQKSIWYTDQFYKNTSITNVSGTCFIKEIINVELLEKAINLVVKNNDALRIRIAFQSNVPKQYFEDYKEFKVECIEVENELEVNEIINEQVHKHIDLLTEKAVKFIIFRLPNKIGGFNIVGSHITADAWGSAKVCSEVVSIYSKLLDGEGIETLNSTTYTDYIKEENEYFNSEKYVKDKTYWEEKFENVSNELAYIIPNNEHIDLDTKAIRKEIQLNNELTNIINEYCKDNKISPYVFFFGVYSIYLASINGLEDIVISTPMLNRRGVKEKEIIGMFVNNLPFRVNIGQEKTIKELFYEIGQDSMQMLRHQKYSYLNLLKYIRQETNISNNLYDVVLSYQNAKTIANESKVEFSAKWNFNGHISETINIHISDIDSEGAYNIYYDYQENKLNEKDVLNIHNRILNIINQIIIKRIETVKDIQIMTNEELEKLQEFNNTGNLNLKNTNIIEIFEEVVKNNSGNIAVKCGEKELTYKELLLKINAFARKLQDKGVNRNVPVAIILDKSIEMIITIFAILKAGGYYIPILPDEQQDRINYIINDCNPLLVITHKDYYKLVENRAIINVDEEKYLEAEFIQNLNKLDDIAYIIYTSGTTGNPKGVKVMHKNICSLKVSLENDITLKPNNKDVSMSLLKYCFDASGIDIYSSMLFGGKLILVEKEDELNPNAVIKLMEQENVTRTFLIPKWLEYINLEDKRLNSNLSSLKILGTGGEILKPELVKSLFDKYEKLKIVNLYGPTETTMFTTYKILNKDDITNNYITIGKPMIGSRALIVNKSNKVLPIGIPGELCIYEDNNSIKNIAQGYLNKIEETNSKFTEIYNPILKENCRSYKTGDIVKINDNLELEFEGRKDDVVKVNGGYLVALNEIEKRIYNILDENYEVAVFAVPFNNTKAIIVFLKNKTNSVKIENLQERIKSNLTFYMHPRKIIELQAVPLNNSGKIDKKKLREMAIDSLKENKTIILPRTSTEQIIYNIIKKYAKSENISVTADFMQDLGIDSLTIASIYAELEDFGITLQDLYNHTNIEELARFIYKGSKESITKISQKVEIKNNTQKFNMKTILLTGVTGFLGIHLLQELLNNSEVQKIYCIIRSKENKDPQERFDNCIQYYFGDNIQLKNMISKKVIILEGNILEKTFGISNSIYDELKESVTTLVNSSANVKHYGKEEEIKSINVESVKNMLDFCKENQISFAHVSTLSLGGFKTKKSENYEFNENSLYIEQNLGNNPYLISKYEAEELILNETFVNSRTFRVGNLMPRNIDGIFQKNYNQNAFMNAIKIMMDLRKVPQEFLDINIELTPVDECASAIIKILSSDSDKQVFHIVNNKLISIKDFIQILQQLDYNMELVTASEFIEGLNTYSGIGKFYIKEYVIKNKVNKYTTKITDQLLDTLDFSWKYIDKIYINSIMKIIEENRWYNE